MSEPAQPRCGVVSARRPGGQTEGAEGARGLLRPARREPVRHLPDRRARPGEPDLAQKAGIDGPSARAPAPPGPDPPDRRAVLVDGEANTSELGGALLIAFRLHRPAIHRAPGRVAEHPPKPSAPVGRLHGGLGRGRGAEPAVGPDSTCSGNVPTRPLRLACRRSRRMSLQSFRTVTATCGRRERPVGRGKFHPREVRASHGAPRNAR